MKFDGHKCVAALSIARRWKAGAVELSSCGGSRGSKLWLIGMQTLRRIKLPLSKSLSGDPKRLDAISQHNIVNSDEFLIDSQTRVIPNFPS
jgi:hypothetical protein